MIVGTHDAAGILWVEARDAPQQPTVWGTTPGDSPPTHPPPPMRRRDPDQYVSSVEVENSAQKLIIALSWKMSL